MIPDPIDATERTEQATVAMPRVAPDGAAVAFVRIETAPRQLAQRRSLCVVEPGGEPRRLTHGANVVTYAWSPDGSQIGFISTRDPDVELSAAGHPLDGVSPQPQVWVLDLERPGAPRQVSTLRYGVHEFDWGPGGDHVVVSAREHQPDRNPTSDRIDVVETERLHHKSDGVGWLDDRASHLYSIDVATRDTVRLDAAVGGGVSTTTAGLQPTWCGGPDTILYTANRSPDAQRSLEFGVRAISPDGTNDRRLLDPRFKPMNLRSSPDGTHVAFVAETPGKPYEPPGLYVLSVEDGSCRHLSADLDRALVVDTVPVWSNQTEVIALVEDRGSTSLYAFPLDDSPRRVVSRAIQDWTIGDVDYAEGTLAACLSRPEHGTELFTGTVPGLDALEATTIERRTRCNDSFVDRHPMPSVHRLTIERAGFDIDTIVYAPPSFDPSDPTASPVLVSIPGGPVSCEVPRYQFDWVYWTSRGYLVARPNYRGSTSYGQRFVAEIADGWGRKEAEDVRAVTDAMIDRGWALPDRILLQGFSHGATVGAFALVGDAPYAAAVLEHGNYDYRGCYGTSDYFAYLEDAFGKPWTNPETYDRISPITEANSIGTPTLLLAGGNDYRAPVSQSEQFYRFLRASGTPAKLVVYPDESHTVSTRRSLHRLETLAEWFQRADPAATA